MENASTNEVTNEENASDQVESSGTSPSDSEQKASSESSASFDAEKALKDLHKWKQKARELEEQAEARRIKDLQDKEKWKDLSEEYRANAEKFKNEANTLRESMIFDRKFSTVKDLAMQAGLRNEALNDLELLNFEDVEIEVTSTGRINVLNAERMVDRLKTSRPHWFGRKNNNINAGDPEVVGSKEVTYDDIYKAEKNARKTGDYAPYKALLTRFKQQNNI